MNNDISKYWAMLFIINREMNNDISKYWAMLFIINREMNNDISKYWAMLCIINREMNNDISKYWAMLFIINREIHNWGCMGDKFQFPFFQMQYSHYNYKIFPLNFLEPTFPFAPLSILNIKEIFKIKYFRCP